MRVLVEFTVKIPAQKPHITSQNIAVQAACGGEKPAPAPPAPKVIQAIAFVPAPNAARTEYEAGKKFYAGRPTLHVTLAKDPVQLVLEGIPKDASVELVSRSSYPGKSWSAARTVTPDVVMDPGVYSSATPGQTVLRFSEEQMRKFQIRAGDDVELRYTLKGGSTPSEPVSMKLDPDKWATDILYRGGPASYSSGVHTSGATRFRGAMDSVSREFMAATRDETGPAIGRASVSFVADATGGQVLRGDSALERGARLQADLYAPGAAAPESQQLTVGEDRSFEVPLGRIAPGTRVELLAVDEAGNRSTPMSFVYSSLEAAQNPQGVAPKLNPLGIAMMSKS